MSGRIVIYYRYDRDSSDRWIRGDRHLRAPIRRFIRGPDPVGGIDLVYLNLLAGLERIGVPFVSNLPFDQIKPGDKIGVIGRGTESLAGYSKSNPILAGVAVVGHPSECPTLFEDYPIARYVVHSPWLGDLFRSTYGDRVVEWAVGIDTQRWAPGDPKRKTTDFLIYDKVLWEHDRVHAAMVEPIRDVLAKRGLTTETIRYGAYKPDDLFAALARCRALLFLCEHETQGLAYQQAMSMGLPVLAWDPGQWLDPWRFRYDTSLVPATSVPFFDARCGTTFTCFEDFEVALDRFLAAIATRAYEPRAYVQEHLTLEVCAQKYVELMDMYL